MILPTKHVATANSLIGVGALLLSLLAHEQTVTRLWERARAANEILTFQHFVLALDLLYTLNAIELNDGVLHRKVA